MNVRHLTIIAAIIFVALQTGCNNDTLFVSPRSAGTSANVYYSAWTRFELANWKLVLQFNKDYELYPVRVPMIDSSIINQGIVLVYVKTLGNPNPTPLPAVFYNSVTNTHNLLTFDLSPDTLTMVFSEVNGRDDPGPAGNYYRYIIIPGGMPVDSGNTPLGQSDYAAVARYFHIHD